MKKVHIVTFPRSGHHAMLEQLESICSIYPNYCEYYNCIGRRGETIECCKSRLNWKEKKFSCGANREIIKDHDFELLLPYNPNRKYIIQFRNPILSIISWYELNSKTIASPPPVFEVFFRRKIKFWCEFVDKWYCHFEKDNVIPVAYENLGSKEELIRISNFLGLPLKKCDKYDPSSFVIKRKALIDDGFLSVQELKVLPYLKKLGLERVVN